MFFPFPKINCFGKAASEGSYTVYQATDKLGVVRYVGRTMQDLTVLGRYESCT